MRLTRFSVIKYLPICFLLTACVSIDNKVSFLNPPQPGTWLKSQRELVACETINSATFMANFGFFHPQCVQLTKIGTYEYRVVERQRRQLADGPMWLVKVIREKKVYWVPVPWHDWL